MKLSLFALACAIACSCGLLLQTSASAESPQTLDRALAAYDYDAQPEPASPSDLTIPSMAAKSSVCGCDKADCGCDDACGPTWTFRLGAVIMKRSNPNAFPIFSANIGGATLVDAADYRFHYRGGLDVGATRTIRDDLAFDFRYFAIDSWTAAQTNPLPAGGSVLNIALPVTFFGFNPANSTYGSNLYSTEFNLRRNHGWLQTYLGYRYVELNEDLNFQLLNSPNALYSESADNRMHGLQFGANANVWNNGNRFRLDSWIKAGIYYDLIRHRSQIEFPPGSPIFTPVNQRDNNTAFLGEIGLVGVYQLTDAIAIRGGYQLLWLDGAALASEQVRTSNVLTGTGAYVHGDVFFHGALVGVEAQW
jgi:hypothetical protein